MSYGIQTLNTSGFTQIDENSEVLQVLQTGTKPTGQAYVTLPNTLPADCLVFGRPQGGRTSGVVTMTGKVEDFVVNGTRYLRAYMQYNLACDYVVVQRCSEFTEPTSGYGINVYKSNGEIGFTSELPMLRVIATRSVTFSTSSGAFDNAWYQGATGSIDSAYVMLGPYIQYQYEQYQAGGENFFTYTFRKARFDYNNHTMGTTYSTSSGDLQRGSSVFTRTNTGQKTEIMGYIV
tara:strand:+ start:87 stop:788 length:702 start_codon:yes stop_codon:yes gene_type:complete